MIDFFNYGADQARLEHPGLYQRLLDRVKPERDYNNRASYREKWWQFGEARGKLRASWRGLEKIVATPETAKHRVFTFVSLPFCPDHKLYAICLEDAWQLGVLSSEVHKQWALAAGGTLEDRPTWTNTTCFATFPFPDSSSAAIAKIGELAEQLDAHRKNQAATHPDLTLTSMYNVLDKLRSGETLTAKERLVHEMGLVSVLRELHDELDAAVLDAYGWSDLLPLLRIAQGNDEPGEGQSRDAARRGFDAAILDRLVALNAERAAEEARGQIRWLRPEFQNPQGGVDDQPEQGSLDSMAGADDEPALAAAPGTSKPLAWPKDPVEQVRAVADVLAASAVPLTEDEIAARFTARGPWKKRLPQLLAMLVTLGRAEEAGEKRYR